MENIKFSPSPEGAPLQVRKSETTGVVVDLKTDSTEVQGTRDLAKIDIVDSGMISTDLSVLNKPQYEAIGTQEEGKMLFDESEADATRYVESPKSVSPRLSGYADKVESPVVEVKDEQQKLEKEPVFIREGKTDGNLSTSTSGAVDCLITETSSLSFGTRISHDGIKSSASDASTNKDDAVGGTEGSSTVSGMLDQKLHILSVSSELHSATEVADSDSIELLSSSTDRSHILRIIGFLLKRYLFTMDE